MLRVLDHLSLARERLLRAGLDEQAARLDAEVLLRHVLGWDRATLLAQQHEPMSQDCALRYDALVERRRRREPVSLIIGKREFWGLEFEVTRDVLTPRPETELIVEEAINAFRHDYQPKLAIDAGTGCGCLAVSLAREFPGTLIIATDISHAALEVARRNAARHNVAARIRFVRTSFLEALEVQADLIVSNPPYVAEPDAVTLMPEIRNHEPAVALLAGADGLDAFRLLLAQARTRLRVGGWFIAECGHDQERGVRQLVAGHKDLSLVRFREDLQQIPRTIVLRRT